MRSELMFRPTLLLERIGQAATKRRRLTKLRGTPASRLKTGHIDSLELLELLGRNAPKIIYDIGANVGTWTLLAKSLFPDSEVHAFEPLTQHVSKFNQNTKAVSGVHLHPVALGRMSEKSQIHITNFSDASSVLEPNVNLADNSEMLSAAKSAVELERLDDYVAAEQLPLPDLIKLDVQGYELEVLRGGSICLRHARHVVSEVSFKEFYLKQPLFEDVVCFLAQNNFRVQALALSTALGRELTQTDALFARSNN